MNATQEFVLNLIKQYAAEVIWIIVLFFLGRIILKLIVKQLVKIVDDGDDSHISQNYSCTHYDKPMLNRSIIKFVKRWNRFVIALLPWAEFVYYDFISPLPWVFHKLNYRSIW